MNQYYIVSGNSRTGPFDMVSLVRKIRNGSLTESTLLQDDTPDSQSKPANEWAALKEFFQEKKEAAASTSPAGTVTRNLDMGRGLRGGWNFFQLNPSVSIVSAIYMLLVIGMIGIAYSILPRGMRGIGYMLCFIFSYFLLSCYLLFVLRIIRGQSAELGYFINKLRTVARGPLVTLSVLVSVPTLIGIFLLTNQHLFRILLARHTDMDESTLYLIVPFIGLIIFMIPGLGWLSMYAFAPLLVLDQGCTPGEAMRKSRIAIFKSGSGNFVTIYIMFIINFIAILLALLPLTISLPITMNAMCEFYEELFS